MQTTLTLIVQVAVILAAARLLGWVMRLIRQPQVLGEMLAGILLGPSLLGWLAPGTFAALFPPESLGALNALSQVGLVLFMFLVGLEFDPTLLRRFGRSALVTSQASIVAPFVLGIGLAVYLYPRLTENGVSFPAFALFVGAAMSVTAFPVLARIMTERNLVATKVGTLTLACAALSDVSAWIILAGLVAFVRSSALALPIWVSLALLPIYVAAMVFVVRRALARLEAAYDAQGRLTQGMTAGILLVLLVSCLATEWLGFHLLFGAFAMGAVMPKHTRLTRDLRERLEDVAVLLLLPLFFAFTGLRTSIGLLSGDEMWLYCLLIVFVAVVGKFGGTAFAARATALSWREAGAVGILMNARGLMELVILSVGLELGVISPALFTMLVIMAVVTTFMTTPILDLVYPMHMVRREAFGRASVTSAQTVLIPISVPSSGPGLLHAARALAVRDRAQRIYALYLERAGERSLTAVRPIRGEELLAPMMAAADALRMRLRPLTFYSRDVARDIVEVAEVKGADLILMAWHKPVITHDSLRGTVQEVLQRARADVAVFLDRGTSSWRRVLVPYRGGPHDRAAIELARRIAARAHAETTVLHIVPPTTGQHDRAGELRRAWGSSVAGARVRLEVVESDSPDDAAVEEAKRGYDLILAGASESSGQTVALFGPRDERFASETNASLLVVRKYRDTAGELAA